MNEGSLDGSVGSIGGAEDSLCLLNLEPELSIEVLADRDDLSVSLVAVRIELNALVVTQ